jgi:hypothetical protein
MMNDAKNLGNSGDEKSMTNDSSGGMSMGKQDAVNR